MEDLHSYIAESCRALNSQAFRVGGIADHIHIACSLPRTLSVSKLLEEIKKTSSQWIKNNTSIPDFSWQSGYGVFSVGQSQLDALVNYIDCQEEHHQNKTYKEELIELLQKYGIEYNEKNMWD